MFFSNVLAIFSTTTAHFDAAHTPMNQLRILSPDAATQLQERTISVTILPRFSKATLFTLEGCGIGTGSNRDLR